MALHSQKKNLSLFFYIYIYSDVYQTKYAVCVHTAVDYHFKCPFKANKDGGHSVVKPLDY